MRDILARIARAGSDRTNIRFTRGVETMGKCRECGVSFGSLRRLKSHWKDSHGGELWPDEEDLGPPETEQRDFNGDEPDDSDHNPQYIGETGEPETEKTKLGDYQ